MASSWQKQALIAVIRTQQDECQHVLSSQFIPRLLLVLLISPPCLSGTAVHYQRLAEKKSALPALRWCKILFSCVQPLLCVMSPH
ncbi:hypothetical protein BG55_21415 [Erwinia mallotivora]|uniref:Uncharacterized protein n=1 Tax=Erwinia mallotivora TaxID=69222 RepID=A0A014PSG3_9GAMM|nr:hypothetical protein BG55_21415 [Erwinia mallotivora]